MIHGREPGSGGKIMLEGFDLLARSFHQRLDAAVGEILHVPDHLMAGRASLRKKPVTDTLHVAADQESAGDFTSLGRTA